MLKTQAFCIFTQTYFILFYFVAHILNAFDFIEIPLYLPKLEVWLYFRLHLLDYIKIIRIFYLVSSPYSKISSKTKSSYIKRLETLCFHVEKNWRVEIKWQQKINSIYVLFLFFQNRSKRTFSLWLRQYLYKIKDILV